MQDTDEGEQAAGGVEVDLHLTGKLATSVHPLQIRDTTAVEAPVITFDRP